VGDSSVVENADDSTSAAPENIDLQAHTAREQAPCVPAAQVSAASRPQLGAERACDAPAVKSRLHFCPLENHLMLVNLKVAITPW
jgi:hypothetical protein